MQTAAAALQNAVSPLKRREPPTKAERPSRQGKRSTANGPALTAGDVDELFNAMGEMYGNKFTSEWGAFDATGAWWAELQFLAPAQLGIGLRRVRQQIQDAARQGGEAWPPTPVVFAAMCQPKPEDLGLPSDAQAWREATANAHQPACHRWSHEAVRMAGHKVGWWNITHVQPSQVARLEGRFVSEYRKIAKSVTKGEWADPRLGHDSQLSKGALAERASREAAQKRLEEEGAPDRMTADQAFRLMRAKLGVR